MAVSKPYDVVIVGAGPAGSSAAIRLAQAGRKVLVLEQKTFPRQKLCGEFVSPECIEHFHELGVTLEVDLALPTSVAETTFYSRSGRPLRIQNTWLGAAEGNAIGLSRSRLDELLLARARTSGAEVREETSGIPHFADGKLKAIKVRGADGPGETIQSDIVIDATGRSRYLSRAIASNGTAGRAEYVAFKAHLTGAQIEENTCELYVYPDGYGGCVQVENDRYNLCFVLKAAQVKQLGSDPNRIWREAVLKNKRASQTLASAAVTGEWLAVPITRLGIGDPSPAEGLLSVGDAASFIDPFTGSGIALAFESSRLAAAAILENKSFEAIAADYRRSYEATVRRRMRFSSYIRFAGKAGWLADGVIWALGRNERLRKFAAARTRLNDAVE